VCRSDWILLSVCIGQHNSTIFRRIYAGLSLFWNFWKPGIGREFGQVQGKGQGICVVREIWLLHLNKITTIPVLYLYCNSFFIHDVHKIILINKFAFVRHFSCNFVWKIHGFSSVWRLVMQYIRTVRLLNWSSFLYLCICVLLTSAVGRNKVVIKGLECFSFCAVVAGGADDEDAEDIVRSQAKTGAHRNARACFSAWEAAGANWGIASREAKRASQTRLLSARSDGKTATQRRIVTNQAPFDSDAD